MDNKPRHIASCLLLLFAMFFCGNTLFFHTHRLFDGHTEVHSHPFLPGSAHSHSDSAFQSFAQLNAALAAMEKAPVAEVPRADYRRIRTVFRVCCSLALDFTELLRGRAPPFAA